MKVLVIFVTLIAVGHLMPGKYYLVETEDEEGNTNTKAKNRKASGKCIGPDCDLQYNDTGELIGCRGIHAVCHTGTNANVRNRKATTNTNTKARNRNVAFHANINCYDGATCQGRNGEAELGCTGPDCIIGYSDSGENIECAGEHAVCGAERKAGGYQTHVCFFHDMKE